MAKKVNPWDEVLNINQWKEEEKVSADEEGSAVAQISSPRTIEDVEIAFKDDDFDPMAIIKNINTENQGSVSKRLEDEAEEARQKEMEDERNAEALKSAKNELVFQQEQAHRDAELFEQEQERARAQMAKSQDGKGLGSLFGKKNTGEKDFGDAEEDAAAEAIEEAPHVEEIEDDYGFIEEPEEMEGPSLDDDEDPILFAEGKVEQRGSAFQKALEKKPVTPKEKAPSAPKQKKERPEKKPKEKPEAPLPLPKEPPAPAPSNGEGFAKKKVQEGGRPKKGGSFWNNLAPQKKPKEEQRAAEAASSEPDWKFVAMHDELTGFFNQNAYSALKKAKHGGIYAVATVDINNLKYVNDTLGHESGDRLIKGVAEELGDIFPDKCYRAGGDEFVVFVKYKSKDAAAKAMGKAKQDLSLALKSRTKKDSASKIPYSVAFGYAVAGDGDDFASVLKKADEAMYADKAAYKKEHPEFDMRRKPDAPKPQPKPVAPAASSGEMQTSFSISIPKLEKEKAEQPKEKSPDDYLTDDQKLLRQKVKDGHVIVSDASTREIVMEIQNHSDDVLAILVSSPTFEQLFIILEVDTFLNILQEMENMIDYSYLYIIYRDRDDFKGPSEYFEQVVSIFTDLGTKLKTNKIRTEKDIQKVKGIGIFKNVYVA